MEIKREFGPGIFRSEPRERFPDFRVVIVSILEIVRIT
jgi:hypothetical protein